MKTNLKLAALLFAAIPFSGCASPDLTPTPSRNDPYPTQQIVFSGEDDLSSHIAISAISKSIDTSGLMHLNIPVRNTTPTDLYIDFRVTYFDENHTPVDVPTAWQTKTLHSNIFEYLDAKSSTARAKDFQIDFRSAQ